MEATVTREMKPLAVSEGDKQPPLLEQTIGSFLAMRAIEMPDNIAVKDAFGRMTYAELNRESDAFAVALRKIGVSAKDRVVTTLGASIAHLIQPKSTEPVLRQVLEHCTRTVLDTDRSLASLRSVVVVENGSPMPQKPLFRSLLWEMESLVERYRGHTLSSKETFGPHDAVNLQLTSGTTSDPKAVTLSHWNILNNASFVALNLGYRDNDKIVCTMPLYHCGGLVAIVLAAMVAGSCVHFACEAFNAKSTLQAIKADACGIVIAVPTMFHAWIDLLDQPEFVHHDFSHLRAGLVGAAPILPSLRKALDHHFPKCALNNAYGLTEMSPVVTMVAPADPPGKRFSSVGRPLPHQNIRITAHDDPRRILPVGEKGEVQASGLVMKGYWNNPQLTDSAVVLCRGSGGPIVRWMRTGDEGIIDTEGYLTITGRIKDIIIRGGENIYPAAIEDIIVQTPGVCTASVIGLPDARYGEVVAAFVVPNSSTHVLRPEDEVDRSIDLRSGVMRQVEIGNDTISAVLHKAEITPYVSKPSDLSEAEVPYNISLSANSLKDLIRLRLSKHMVPKYFFWTDELPLTPTGKVAKTMLKREAMEALSKEPDTTTAP